MKNKSKIKYFLRFTFLQAFLTYLTIFYFDTFLIGNYRDGFLIISRNLLEDRDRFYSFISNEFVKIDIYLAIFIFIFLILLYSSKFYSIVNELTFTIDKNLFDEYLSIYLIWSASFLSFLQIFRFTAVSRGYLFLYTLIVPLVLVLFRNTEALSSVLGRNVTNENYITFNFDKDSLLGELRLLKFRNCLDSFVVDNLNFEVIQENIEKVNKNSQLNLVVINLKDIKNIDLKFEKYLLNLNKKILLISDESITFQSKFLGRFEKITNKNLTYINNDIQVGSQYILKRIFDITISIFGLIILSPIILATTIYLLIKDGRPIIIKQTRVGMHGKKFNMYKFRTMKVDAHQERNLLNEMNKKTGPLFKLENDPRIIVGAEKIRKFSIDEIPQFLNVLKGEMSIVGPRPLFPEDSDFYNSHYIRRLNVLPGITGLLQINERNTDDFDVWFKYDLEYVENWNLYLDLTIVLKTPSSLFRNKTKGF